jgi:hypothetical protein
VMLATPMTLSEQQLDAIHRASRPLAPAARDQFLQALAERLSSLDHEVGDGELHRIIVELQRAHFDPPLSGYEPHGHRVTTK